MPLLIVLTMVVAAFSLVAACTTTNISLTQSVSAQSTPPPSGCTPAAGNVTSGNATN